MSYCKKFFSDNNLELETHVHIRDMLVLALFACLVTSGTGQVHSLSATELQQCTTDLACSIDYGQVFQAKLDNVTHFMELELELLRHQVNNKLVPMATELDQLRINHTYEMAQLKAALTRAEEELAHDRQFLANLTRGVYILNDELHKENLGRYQDVHALGLQLNEVHNNISTLSIALQALVAQAGNGSGDIIVALQSIGNKDTNCPAAQGSELAEIRANLTYYINAFTSSQKAVENVRALEAFLQTQVVELKANLSQTEYMNHVKDNVIISLQNQLKLAQANVATVPSPATCKDPLGMKSGGIPASAITASASQAGYEPSHARLDDVQGWYTPERTATTDYLQIDTGAPHYISKVDTQGAPCCDVMVTNYTLQYSNDGTQWHQYKVDCNIQYLAGNTDASSVVEHTLSVPILARYVRFNIVDFKKDGVSNYVGMRVELYGCTK